MIRKRLHERQCLRAANEAYRVLVCQKQIEIVGLEVIAGSKEQLRDLVGQRLALRHSAMPPGGDANR